MSYANPNDFDPRDSHADLRLVQRFAIALAIFVATALILIAAGCAHLQPAVACPAAVTQEIQGCMPMGEMRLLSDDGFGVAISAACGLDSATPKQKIVVVTESPTIRASVLKNGGVELTACRLGEVDRFLLVMEAPLADTRASN